jgi:crotonobetainyl-CoA:carnitine CoA-transferase CaiB-like acyl-CoA transferase
MTPTGGLDGVVVLDFTWVVAGPQATRLLAAWGADVIKIEWPERLDVIRFETPPPAGVEAPPDYALELSGFFNDLNANKSSVTLNMRDEAGRVLFERLLAHADVVVENFSPAAMEKWGYDYDAMARINPKIIYLSLSGYGHTGRSRYYLTYGPSAQALSGLTFGSGLPSEEPAGWGFSYMDQIAGYTGAMAIVMSLIERERSGVGQYIDLSQAEAGMALTGAAFLDFVVNGRPGRRSGFPPGNRSSWSGGPASDAYRSEPLSAPHNTYRCLGDDENGWCVIVARTEEEWRTLADATGDAELAGDRFATLEQRLEHQDELDDRIEAWTRTLDKYEVMTRLQATGVPCGAVQSSADRMERDPQLRDRGVFSSLEHAALGRRRFQQVPVQMTATPPLIRRPAPLIGSSNEAVLQRLLGMDRAEVTSLTDAGLLWPSDMPRPSWVSGRSKEET